MKTILKNEKHSICFITSKTEILKALLQSKEEKKALGIWSGKLGRSMLLCVVKEMWTDDDEQDIIIVLNDHDVISTGAESRVVYLNEIDRIYLYT